MGKDLEIIENGILEMRAGNYESAENLYNTAIELSGENLHRAYYNKGVLYHLHLSNFKEAKDLYQEAINLDSEYGYAWYNLGEVLCHYNSYQEAQDFFLRAMEIMPKEASPSIGFAFTQNRLNNFGVAIDVLEEVLEMEGLSTKQLAKTYSELGLAHLKYNHPTSVSYALEYFKEAYEINPKDYQTCYNLAFLADMYKNYEEALLFYDEAIALKPNNSGAYQGKACTYINMKKYHEGLTFIQKAIDLNPDYFEGYYNLACVHAGLKNKEDLIEAIKKTVALAPPQIEIKSHILNDSDFLPYSKQEEFIETINQMA